MNLFRISIKSNKIINALLTKNQLVSHQKHLIRLLNYSPIITENKIHVGHKMTQVIDKYRQKALINEIEKKKTLPKRHKQHLLISSSTPSFNHYYGQTYKNFNEKNLASVS
jgi:hypothetical protein